jgi:hypothetical protein
MASVLFLFDRSVSPSALQGGHGCRTSISETEDIDPSGDCDCSELSVHSRSAAFVLASECAHVEAKIVALEFSISKKLASRIGKIAKQTKGVLPAAIVDQTIQHGVSQM